MRFVVVSAVAASLMLGTGMVALADEATDFGSELTNDMGLLANEARGEMQAQPEQMGRTSRLNTKK